MEKILSFVKEQYFFEAERRDKLNTGSSFSIGLATVNGSIVANTFSKLQAPFDVWSIVALSGLLAWVVCMAFFANHVVRFFFGLDYKYVATSASIKQHYDALSAFTKDNPDEGTLDENFDDFLIQTFTRSATKNCENNDLKSRRLYAMNKWVMVSIVPALLSGVSLGISGKLKPAEAQRIIIVADESSGKPAPAPAPTPRPSPPPERSVRDGANYKPPKTR